MPMARAAALQEVVRVWDIYDALTQQAVLENDLALLVHWLQHCGCCCRKQDRAAHRQAR